MSDPTEDRLIELSEKAERFFTLDGQPIDDHVAIPRQTIKALAEVVRAARELVAAHDYASCCHPATYRVTQRAIAALDSQEQQARR